MQDINAKMQNIGFQIKNLEMQFENINMQVQKMEGIPNFGSQIQNIGMQMFNLGIQIFDIGNIMPNMEMNIINIKNAMEKINLQMQNIINKLNMKITNMGKPKISFENVKDDNKVSQMPNAHINYSQLPNANIKYSQMPNTYIKYPQKPNDNIKYFKMPNAHITNNTMMKNTNNKKQINVTFKTTNGLNNNLSFDYGTTINEMLESYLKWIERDELIGKENKISFFFNAKKVKFGDHTNIEDYQNGDFISFPPTILVYFLQ